MSSVITFFSSSYTQDLLFTALQYEHYQYFYLKLFVILTLYVSYYSKILRALDKSFFIFHIYFKLEISLFKMAHFLPNITFLCNARTR